MNRERLVSRCLRRFSLQVAARAARPVMPPLPPPPQEPVVAWRRGLHDYVRELAKRKPR